MDVNLSQYGSRADQKITFTGTSKALWPPARRGLLARFAQAGVQIPEVSKPWMQVQVFLFATKPAEQVQWTAEEIADPANAVTVCERKIKVGDYKLSAKNFNLYSKEDYKVEVLRNLAVSTILETVP